MATGKAPITPSTKSLERFLEHIQLAGVPSKVNMPYLKSVGFKSGNDSYLVPIFKTIGFLDASGAPTKEWQAYRNKSEARSVLGRAVKQGYSDLFKIYPDADRKDDEAIHNWIRANTDFDEAKVKQAVSTFRVLTKHADFAPTQADSATIGPSGSPAASPVVPVAAAPVPQPASGPTININVELHLPPSEDGVSYDKLFEAMKKHLFPDGPAPS